MKKFRIHPIIIHPIIIVLVVMFGLGFTQSTVVFGATTPSLNTAATYGVLSSTYTNTSAGTTITGDVGFTTPPAVAPGGVQTNYGSGAPYSTAGIDQGSALGLLNSQVCDFTFGSATDLSLLTQPLAPGVYCVTGAQSVGTGGITLVSGTYIFRSTGALNTVANSVVSGGDACDVFWTPVATTLGANSTFTGTVIDDAGITVGANTIWTGRALSFGGTVTTDTDTITVPVCPVVSPIVPAPVPVVVVASSTPTQTSSPPQTSSSDARRAINLASLAAINTATPQPEVFTEVPSAPTPITYPTVYQLSALPSLPNTGGGGEASKNLAVLLGSVTLIALGLAHMMKKSKFTLQSR